jgi:UDP-2,3-diacylglucosamine hydrolase
VSKIACISDVHLLTTYPHDERYKALNRFFSFVELEDVQDIVLLGDIFNLLVGGFDEYVEEYSEVWAKLANLIKRKKRIYYINGNHDFHLSQLFSKVAKKYGFNRDQLKEIDFLNLEIDGKTFLFFHGDDIDLGDWKYRFYKRLIRSSFFRYIAEHISTYQFVKKVAESLAQKSKSYQREFNYDFKKNHYREEVKKLFLSGYDYVVAGHTHIKDHYIVEESGKKYEYINAGYFPTDYSFTLYQNKKWSILSI